MSAASDAMLQSAQVRFRGVVREQLQGLLSQGVERRAAVRQLLRRITPASATQPARAAVDSTMRSLRLCREDALRALLVKREVDRLVCTGMDPIGAFSHLTARMAGRTAGVPVSPRAVADAALVTGDGDAGSAAAAAGTAVVSSGAGAGAGAGAAEGAGSGTQLSVSPAARAARKRPLPSGTTAGGAGGTGAQVGDSVVQHKDKRVRFVGPDGNSAGATGEDGTAVVASSASGAGVGTAGGTTAAADPGAGSAAGSCSDASAGVGAGGGVSGPGVLGDARAGGSRVGSDAGNASLALMPPRHRGGPADSGGDGSVRTGAASARAKRPLVARDEEARGDAVTRASGAESAAAQQGRRKRSRTGRSGNAGSSGSNARA